MRIAPVLLLCAAMLAGCGSSDDNSRYLEDTGGGAIAGTSGRLTLGVNSFLWRASLDTLSALPLVSADPFGGVIIFDWISYPASPDERIKVTVYISDRELRADGLKIVVFRQTRANGAWSDAAASPDTAHQLENAVLTRARELRLATMSTSN